MSAVASLDRHGFRIPRERIAEFCCRWRIHELSVFGSYLRDDFGPGSDLDFLYTFAGDVHWTFADLDRMERELQSIVGHRVDLVSRGAVERSKNPMRRRQILGTAEPVYGMS